MAAAADGLYQAFEQVTYTVPAPYDLSAVATVATGVATTTVANDAGSNPRFDSFDYTSFLFSPIGGLGLSIISMLGLFLFGAYIPSPTIDG